MSLPSSFIKPPFRCWKATLRSPQSLLFSGLNIFFYQIYGSFNASQRLSGLLTADPHASLRGLEISAHVLLSSSSSLKSMKSTLQIKSMLGQNPADLVKENEENKTKTTPKNWYSWERVKPIQSKREFCSLLSAAGKLLFINRSKKMLKIIGKMTWGREKQC